MADKQSAAKPGPSRYLGGDAELVSKHIRVTGSGSCTKSPRRSLIEPPDSKALGPFVDDRVVSVPGVSSIPTALQSGRF